MIVACIVVYSNEERKGVGNHGIILREILTLHLVFHLAFHLAWVLYCLLGVLFYFIKIVYFFYEVFV